MVFDCDQKHIGNTILKNNLKLTLFLLAGKDGRIMEYLSNEGNITLVENFGFHGPVLRFCIVILLGWLVHICWAESPNISLPLGL